MKTLFPILLATLLCMMPADPSRAAETDSTQSALYSTDLAISRNTSFNVYPYAYYTPEIELAFGVGGIITFYTAEDATLRPSKIGVSGYYSTSKQYKIGLSPQLYFLQNAIFASLKLYVSDQIYYTPDINNPEVDALVYGLLAELHFPALVSITKSRKNGLILDYQHVDIDDDDHDPDGKGTHTLGLGTAWVWDSRDNIFYPMAGGLYDFKAIFYSKDLGSDYDFNRYTIDLRKYWGIKREQEQVLALQLLGDFARGDPPFYRLPALGGANIMRGYKSGTIRDRNLICGQFEARTHLWRKIGGVAFTGIGGVAEEFDDFRLNDLKFSCGVGLRYKFNPKEGVNLRMDLGFGEHTDGIYFGVQEAF